MGVVPAVEAGVLTFLLLTALVFPAGWVILTVAFPKLPAAFRPLAAPAISIALFVSILACGTALGLAPRLLGILFQLTLVSAVAFSIQRGVWREWLEPSFIRGLLLMGIYYLLALSASAYPHGRIADVKPDTIQNMTGLAVDNLIPYDVSRYFTEQIPPQAEDVVPDWRFTDRGPLAGMFAAAVFLLLGIQDGTHWLGATDGVYFIFEAVLVYLNLLSLLCVWMLGNHYFGRRAAASALLILSSSYFFFVNTYFTWPKLLSAYFFLFAVTLFEAAAPAVLAGLLFAEAMLAHDAVVFAFAAFLVFVFIREARKTSGAKGAYALFHVPIWAFAWYAPWQLYKLTAGSGGGRLLYNHAFCFKNPDTFGIGIVTAAKKYFAENSLADIIQVRVENLLYPLNIFHSAGSYRAFWNRPYDLALSVSHLAFYQLLYAVGLPTVLLLLMAAVRGKSNLGAIQTHAAAAYGALLPAGLIFACALSTVNHAWAYPAFLLTAICAGRVASGGGIVEAVLCGAAVAVNLVLAIFSFGFAKGSFVMQHASGEYLLLMFSFSLMYFGMLLGEVCTGEE